jgi:tetratricopeptide (TPR) repeat protein
MQNLGRVLFEMDRMKEAEEAYVAALRARRELCRLEPLYLAHRKALVGSVESLGIVRRRLGKGPQAELQESVDVLEEMKTKFPDDPETAKLLQDALAQLGKWQSQVGKHAEAEKSYRRFGLLAAEFNNNKRWQKYAQPFRPAEAASKVALELLSQGKREDGLKALDQAEKMITPHLRPGAPSLVYETLAQCMINRGVLLVGRDPVKAEAEMRRALKTLDGAPEKDGKLDPRVPLQRARALSNLGGLLWKKDAKKAGEHFDEALRLLEGLVREDDTNAEALAELGAAWMNKASLAMEARDLRQAKGLMEKAIATQKKALELAPFSARSRGYLRRHYRQQAVIQINLGEHKELVKTAEGLSKAFEGDWVVALEAAQAVAAAHTLAGRDARLGLEARASVQEQLARTMRDHADEVARRGKGVPRAHASLAYFLVVVCPRALRDPARAIEHAQKARLADRSLQSAWEAEALAQHRAGRSRLALEFIASYQSGTKQPLAVTEYTAAMCHAHLGETDRAKERLKAGDEARARVKSGPEVVGLAAEARRVVNAAAKKGP